MLITLLTRLQTSKTDKYTYGMVYFLLYTLAIDHGGWTPDILVAAVEEVQPQCVLGLSPFSVNPY